MMLKITYSGALGAYEISIARSIIQSLLRHQAKGFTYKIPVNFIFKTICRIDAMAWLSADENINCPRVCTFA